MQGALKDPFGLKGAVLEGQYRVDEVVGEGGFGVVYRGRHLTLDQPVAIKALKGLDGGDAKLNALVLEKFRAEARLLYTLSQSSLNIVRAIDSNATMTPVGLWAPFMVLEWLDGRSLEADLADRRAKGLGGRPLGEALTILGPIAEGLTVAHKQQVIHRDIKPANVFLVEGGRVKVLDFGIAKILKETETGIARGTLGSFTWLYAAPEQLDPRVGPTGFATDVYAYALLVTELLTGKAPIDENDVAGVMRAAMDPTRRPTPRARGANVTDELEAVCARALSVDPKNRFATVEDFWVALHAAGKTRSATTMQRPAVPSRPSLPSHPHSGQMPRASMPSAAMWTPPPPTPPGYQAWGPSPPRGTAPPGMHPTWVRRLPVRPPEGMSTGMIVLIIFAVVFVVFMGSCAMCVAVVGAGAGG